MSSRAESFSSAALDGIIEDILPHSAPTSAPGSAASTARLSDRPSPTPRTPSRLASRGNTPVASSDVLEEPPILQPVPGTPRADSTASEQQTAADSNAPPAQAPTPTQSPPPPSAKSSGKSKNKSFTLGGLKAKTPPANSAAKSSQGLYGVNPISRKEMTYVNIDPDKNPEPAPGPPPPPPKPIRPITPDPNAHLLPLLEQITIDGCIVIHVRPGSEYQALLYLLRTINRTFGRDEVLPDVPEELAEHAFKIIRWSDTMDANGDARTSLLEPTMPRGLLLRRVRLKPRETWEFDDDREAPDSTEIQRRKPATLVKLAEGLQDEGEIKPMTQETKALLRKMADRPPIRSFEKECLIPVALPANVSFILAVAQAIKLFNLKGLTLTPLLDQTCRAISSAIRTQGMWRAKCLRGRIDFKGQVAQLRAVRVIKRAWRRYLFKQRMKMLEQCHAVGKSLSNLLLGGELALDVASVENIKARAVRPMNIFREHKVKFGFDPQGYVFVTAEANEPRMGLPEWTHANVPVISASEVKSTYGNVKLFGAQHAVELLTHGTVWKNANHQVLPQVHGLPLTHDAAEPDDFALQITFCSAVEARNRACLLLCLTYDPIIQAGSRLIPLHAIKNVKKMAIPAADRAAGAGHAGVGELEGHRWAAINEALSRPGTSEVVMAENHLVLLHQGPPSRTQLPSQQRPDSRNSSPFASSSRDTTPPQFMYAPPRFTSSPAQALSAGYIYSPAGSPPGSPLEGLFSHSNSSIFSRGSFPLNRRPSELGSLGNRDSAATGYSSRAASPLRSSRQGSPLRSTRAISPHHGSRQGSPSMNLQRPSGSPGMAQRPYGSPGHRNRGGSPYHMSPNSGPLGAATQGKRSMQQVRSLRERDVGPMDSSHLPPLPVGSSRHGHSAGSPSFEPLGSKSNIRLPPVVGGTSRRIPRSGEDSFDPLPSTTGGFGFVNDPSNGVQTGMMAGDGFNPVAITVTGASDFSPTQSPRLPSTWESPFQSPSRTRSERRPDGLLVDADVGAHAMDMSHSRTSTQSIGGGRLSARVRSPYGPGYEPHPEGDDMDMGLDMTSQIQPWGSSGALPTVFRQSPDPQAHLLGAHSPTRLSSKRLADGPGTSHPEKSSMRRAQELGAGAGAWSFKQGTRVSKAPTVSAGADATAADGHSVAGVGGAPRAGSQAGSHNSAAPSVANFPARGLGAVQGGAQMSAQESAWGRSAARGQEGEGEWPAPGGLDYEMTPAMEDQLRLLNTLSPNSKLLYTVNGTIQRAMDPQKMILLPIDKSYYQARANALQLNPGSADQSQRQSLRSGEAVATTTPLSGCTGSLFGTGPLPMLEEEEGIPAELQVRASLIRQAMDPRWANFEQANYTRDMNRLNDSIIVAEREEAADEKKLRGHALTTTDLLWIKHTNTGHALAPGYMPLPPGDMAELVAGMRNAYQADLAYNAARQKQEHELIMSEIKYERKEAMRDVNEKTNRQMAVAGAMVELYKEAVTGAKSNRVTMRAMKEARKQRVKQDRAFSSAFVRQAGHVAKTQEKTEKEVKAGAQFARTWAVAAVRRAANEDRAEKIIMSKKDMEDFNQWKAMTVKAAGYTQNVQLVHEAAEQLKQDEVALRRFDEQERHRRVGPAGGVWGSHLPREMLREPLKLTSVVSATEAAAKQQEHLLRHAQLLEVQGEEQGEKSLPRGAYAYKASSALITRLSQNAVPSTGARVPTPTQYSLSTSLASGNGRADGSLTDGGSSAMFTPLVSPAMTGGGSPLRATDSSSLPGQDDSMGTVPWGTPRSELGGGEREEEQHAGAVQLLPDLLPEFPYAKGSTLYLRKRNNPAGVIT